MGIAIREARPDDAAFLQRMVLEAAHVPDAHSVAPDEAFKDHPDLLKYVEDFGDRPGDAGFVAVEGSGDGEQPVGAVWVRQFGAGDGSLAYVDDRTPELAIAVAPEQRGQGVGTRLMVKILTLAKKWPGGAVSLSCRDDNRALRMYERMGFRRVEGGESVNRAGGKSWVMRVELHHGAS